MIKVCITGTTRGLGKSLAEHFNSKGYEVVELNRGDVIVESAIGCDLFINNAYINGHQIDIFNQLYDKVGKMIVMGSVAADYPDPQMPEYSQHKRELKERVLEVASKNANILLLQLTGESYNDTTLIKNTIDFWLDNPKVTCISFVHGEPNG
jgi:NADP-dependent 3-hydroxy acid dehydrogenase YdfG